MATRQQKRQVSGSAIRGLGGKEVALVKEVMETKYGMKVSDEFARDLVAFVDECTSAWTVADG